MKRCRKQTKKQLSFLENRTYLKLATVVVEATKNNTTHQKYIVEAQKIINDTSDSDIYQMLVFLTKKHFEIGDGFPQVICFMEFITNFLCNLEKEHQIISHITSTNNTNIDSVEDALQNTQSQMHVLMQNMLEFLMDISNADCADTRKLSLQFIKIILNNMGDRSIDDELFNQLSHCMIERAQDVKSKVRAEAMYALKRLQNPLQPDDAIYKMYRFHLKHDPAVIVRKAVLDSIGYTPATRDIIITRILDIDESVRLMAYERIYQMPLKSIKLAQRHHILYMGFKDTSDKVKKYIENILIPSWFMQSNKSILNLIDSIRHDSTVQKKIANDIVIEKVLNIMFKNLSIKELYEELSFDEETRLLPVNQLFPHTLIYWRSFAEYLIKNGIEAGADVDLVLPTLCHLVELMRAYDAHWASIMAIQNPTKEQILDQLDFNVCRLEFLKMVELHSLGDELGREKLNEFLLNYLLCNKYLNENTINMIVKILHTTCLSFINWHKALLNVINEIYEPALTLEGPIEVPMPTLQKSHEIDMKKAHLKVEIIELETCREQALLDKDYKKAEECDNKLTSLKIELEQLHAATIIVQPTTECHIVEQERNVTKDLEEIKKILMILYAMLSLFNHKPTPEIRIIFQDIVHPNLSTNSHEIEYWSLRCAGAICINDLSLARLYFPLFFTKIFAESLDLIPLEASHRTTICNTTAVATSNIHSIPDLALQIVFDLLLAHSVEDFEHADQRDDYEINDGTSLSNVRKLFPLSQEQDDYSMIEKTVSNKTTMNRTISEAFIDIIMKLLQESEMHSTRLIVVQGLSKMLLHNKITSDKIIGYLLLMYHHPEMDLAENNDIRQHIVLLFSTMAVGLAGGPEVLINSLLPALMIVKEAPALSPLKRIELFDILKLVIAITSSVNATENSACTHNLLALTICDGLKRVRRDEEMELALSKALAHCNIIADDQLRADLTVCINQLQKTIKSKLAAKFLQQALVNIETGSKIQEAPADNPTINDKENSIDSNNVE